jgi:RNA polymerase-binding transcription factor DksA
MHEGTYGICRATNRPIARERLMKVPYAVLCEDALERGDPNHIHEEY